MKADPQLTRIPVIGVSGSAQESDISRAYDMQIAAYLVKLMKCRRLLLRLAKNLRTSPVY
jgi:CheY-like chemotaxis protein